DLAVVCRVAHPDFCPMNRRPITLYYRPRQLVSAYARHLERSITRDRTPRARLATLRRAGEGRRGPVDRKSSSTFVARRRQATPWRAASDHDCRASLPTWLRTGETGRRRSREARGPKPGCTPRSRDLTLPSPSPPYLAVGADSRVVVR